MGRDLTPRAIVAELDRFIVGQGRAKRAVAIALRNRLRRLKLPPAVAEEIAPKNILMIGSTGIGKTEIARRLARLTAAPFLKVEATKYTEVGYVGRDVESMVRDLAEIAAEMVRQEQRRAVAGQAGRIVEDRLVALLMPGAAPADPGGVGEEAERRRRQHDKLAGTLRAELQAGRLEDRMIEVDVAPAPPAALGLLGGAEDLATQLRDMMPGLFPGAARRRRLPVTEAREVLRREEEERLIDAEEVAREAVRRVEETGILFIDELDKIAGREGGHGPEVSREGVQRDLLPIIEGTTVRTRQGMVRTDSILFIAAGAFHVSRPSDLIPELQGRFPIRVELEPLTRDDFVRILTEPENALTRQYSALLGADDVALTFTPDGIEALAECAALVNEKTEDIGARRLHTVLERVLEEISFAGPEAENRRPVVDGAYVRERLGDLAQDEDHSKYIL